MCEEGSIIGVFHKLSDLEMTTSICKANALGEIGDTYLKYPTNHYIRRDSGGGIVGFTSGYEKELMISKINDQSFIFGYSGDYELRVVNDQSFSPTYTKDLAAKIAQLIRTEYYGIFHITNKGSCSWHEFAREILKQARLETPVIPVSSDQYPQEARRPRFSVLDNYQLRLLGMDDMRPWQEALRDYMISKGHTGQEGG